MRLLTLTLLIAATASAQPDLGETSFPNSGAVEAQEPFVRGLLLLHSFEYDDARRAFQRAREVDPGFAMAAWGEAMTWNHPVWQRQDRDAALAALGGEVEQSMDFSALTTDREWAYLATLAVLFGDGDKDTRDDRYADAMRRLAADYPDDLDAQTFYALALLGTAHEGRDFTVYMKAAAVLEGVFAQNPRHPGAAHYLIHAYDDPVHAPLGLRPARVYADVAPAASHALHMPSHITLALGMWPETAALNERSYLAAKAGTDGRGEPLNGHGWHALAWWAYAEVQQLDFVEAGRLLAVGMEHQRAAPSVQGHAYLVAMRGALATDPDAGGDLPDLVPFADASPSVRLRDHYARAWVALDGNDREAFETATADFFSTYDAEADPSLVEQAAAQVLRGFGTDDDDAALDLIRQGAELEQASPLTFGPPSFAVPPVEAYAVALLAAGRYAQAVGAFRQSLARTPGRTRSLIGLHESASSAGLHDVADDVRETLLRQVSPAPPSGAR